MSANGESQRHEAAYLAVAGGALYPIVVLGFVFRAGVPPLEAALLGILVELLPILAVAQLPLAQRAVLERLPAYAGSAVAILAIGVSSLMLGLRSGGPVRLGLGPISWSTLWMGGVALIVGVGLIVGLFEVGRTLMDLHESPLLEHILPVTVRERVAFVGLSLAAGFGEEIAFRGFAITALAPVLSDPWRAALFTSAAFGVLHAYQGALGMVRTAVIGFLFAASFLSLGSLWPAIVAHVVVDVVGGLWLGPLLVRRGRAHVAPSGE